jgi:copper transport protein
VLLAAGSLAWPAGASAHATLVRTVPANGAVLAHAPRKVTVVFDDTVRVGHGNAVVANGSQRSVLAGKPTVDRHVLTLPLRAGLPDGDYSVRWSIVSDDGHEELGVLAFAVGAGRAPPTAVLGAGGSSGWGNAALRWLYFSGLLVAAGAAVFGLLARPIVGDRIRAPLSRLIFFALLAAFSGGSGLLQSSVSGTRFQLVLQLALLVAIAGGVAAALTPVYARLLVPAFACALALLAAPTLAGHALDRDQPRWLSVPADLAHVTAAAVWLGGLVSLVLVLPRATRDPAKRRAVVRRFSTTALISVCAIGASGVARALTELDSVSQVWSTSYGRALLVKSALLLPVLGLGWLNRTALLDAFARLRRSAMVEATLLVGVLAAVGVLTQARPGVVRAALPAAAVTPQPPVLPPRSAVVDAHGVGALVVAIARLPGRETVTLVGSANTGVSGRDVRIDGRRATACGSGCYTAAAASGPVRVTVDGARTVFAIPSRARRASAVMRDVTRRYRASKSIVFDESLSAESGSPGFRTRFTVVAPNRLSYETKTGLAAIVIGARRWDRAARGRPFVESPQTPLDVTQPLWSNVSNAHEVAPGVLTFLDRSLPAWFRVEVANRRPRIVQMEAASHFMVERYVEFDAPVEVSPPSR